jgi:hypothetical protein
LFRASLEIEILLRHQLNILRRKSPKRPTFGRIDRTFDFRCPLRSLCSVNAIMTHLDRAGLITNSDGALGR